ncbi:MAG TPA: site-specific integrase [Bryobacteraceae bacterium]|jgi:integrase|nr:site-specific integrase [Bryobacteraceae bacterium]
MRRIAGTKQTSGQAAGIRRNRRSGAAIGRRDLTPHDLRRTCAKLCRKAGGELEQIQLLLGHASIQTTERYLGTKQDLVQAVNDRVKIRAE